MKKIIFLTSALLGTIITTAQVVSLRVVQSSYSAVDPDAGGPATGSVIFRFEIMSSAVIPAAESIGLSAAFQSVNLMATPSNTTVPLGPLAAAVGTGWTQQVDNRAGAIINPTASYGGRNFDRRMVVSFNMPPNGTPMMVPMAWTAYCQITYWTLSNSVPEGGYVVNEMVANNEISSDGGLTVFQMQSPNLNNPTPLGSGVLPVLFTKFDANCSGNGTVLSWATAQEANSSRFDIEKSNDGNSWKTIGTVAAAGNSSINKNYQQLDLDGGTAFYRIKQIDKDGQYIYTIVERTNCQVKNIKSAIYPVPAKDILNVVIKSDRSIRTQLLIFDMQGKMVKKMDAPIIAGNNNFRVNLSGLVSGDYLIRTNDATIMMNKVFTIVK